MQSASLQIAVSLFLMFTVVDVGEAQNVPVDLEIIATAGGLHPDAGYATIRITADGQATYRRFESADLSPAVESNTFQLTPAEMKQIWQVIETGDFFSLDSQYAAAGIEDRTFAELMITANGSTHAVSTRNIAVAGFDDVISSINDVSPGTSDLVYDVSEPFTFTPLDVCEQPGKRGAVSVEKPGLTTPKPSSEGILTSVAKRPGGGAHPGTAVAYRLSLQEAVSRGIVTLTSKGGAYGDAMSITVDNGGSETGDNLSLTLYLELWGPAASIGNALKIEAAIESFWGGKKSNGKTLDVDVMTRTCVSCTAAPGTDGYHQIKLVADSTITSNVVGRGDTFDVNRGTGSGTWETVGSKLNELWAHEAGHLLGLEDRYEDYRKQPDGTWKRESDDAPFTTSELADLIAPFRPDLTLAEIIAKLEDGRRRATHPEEGSEEDLMAWERGIVQQEDIDWLASHAGLIIEVPAGGVLMNKAGSQQNFVTIRSDDIFVLPGETKTLGGLYVSCIDAHKGVPSTGVGFDVAPPLAQWSGVEAASYLQTLVNYVDEQELYCGGAPLFTVWRITDNSNVAAGSVAAMLHDAGIELPDQPLDFPRLTGANTFETTTSLVTPPELFVPDVISTPGDIIEPGETVSMTGIVHSPTGVDISSSISWTLDSPAGSFATLTNTSGESSQFTADVRGIYRASMAAEVTDPTTRVLMLETIAPFSAADERTETFESGVIDPALPFYWEPGSNPWSVTDLTSHTGTYSATSGEVANGATATLRARFEQPADGDISFAYKVFSGNIVDSLVFSVDGIVQGRWSFKVDWSTFAVKVGPGTHTVEWAYKRADTFGGGDVRRAWIDDVFFPSTAVFTAIDEAAGDALPHEFALAQNYPNPFNPRTTISYALPIPSEVALTVTDLLGREVGVLEAGQKPAGTHEVIFDSQDLPSGVYVYRLTAGKFEAARLMVVLR